MTFYEFLHYVKIGAEVVAVVGAVAICVFAWAILNTDWSK